MFGEAVRAFKMLCAVWEREPGTSSYYRSRIAGRGHERMRHLAGLVER